METLKPGDKVTITLDDYDIHNRNLNPKDFEGKVFTVEKLPCEKEIYIEGYHLPFFASQCKLVDLDMPTISFKPGDIVKVIKPDHWAYNRIGKVTRINQTNIIVDVNNYHIQLQPTEITLVQPEISTPPEILTPPPPMNPADLITQILASGESPILVGPTGSGKTHVLKHSTLASLDLNPADLTIIQVSRETSRYDLLGYKSSTGTPIPGFLTERLSTGSGLIIIDELDKGNENTLLVLKGYFAGYIETPCGNYTIDRTKLFLAVTANTVGAGASLDYNAAVRQDQALLNEFILVNWDYQDDVELEVINAFLPRRKFYLDNTRLANLYPAAFRELRTLCKTNSYTEIFSTRQLRQACSLMLLADWNFSSVIKATSLREADIVSFNQYEPILTKYDAAFRLTDTEIAVQAAKEAESKKNTAKEVEAAKERLKKMTKTETQNSMQDFEDMLKINVKEDFAKFLAKNLKNTPPPNLDNLW